MLRNEADATQKSSIVAEKMPSFAIIYQVRSIFHASGYDAGIMFTDLPESACIHIFGEKEII